MKKRFLLLIYVLLLLFMGCSKEALIRKYYLVEIPSEVIITAADSTLQYKVDIRDFNVSKAFNQTRIAVRTESNEVNYYFYHHWAVRPSVAIADMVYNIVEAKNIFYRCSRDYSYDPDFILEGYVQTIEHVMQEKKVSARLALIFRLIKTPNQVPVVKYEFDRTIDLKDDRTMNGFAHAISIILQEETEIFLNKLSAELGQSKPE
ncbi:membrane integrity-associated transporter subunit PqiC [candidate division KSB1 bacterium]|nr:membrane integrity-associated transporter subunit PqiC [candidate division KSB1 bacterium]